MRPKGDEIPSQNSHGRCETTPITALGVNEAQLLFVAVFFFVSFAWYFAFQYVCLSLRVSHRAASCFVSFFLWSWSWSRFGCACGSVLGGGAGALRGVLMSCVFCERGVRARWEGCAVSNRFVVNFEQPGVPHASAECAAE